MNPKTTSCGPLYPGNPLIPHDGWYEWNCPVCGSKCYDRETMSETECQNGHLVRLAVVGTEGDGYRMVAEVDANSLFKTEYMCVPYETQKCPSCKKGLEESKLGLRCRSCGWKLWRD
jgi:predicted RNA-binding Zn-ribbon protein involved in translation (DUF1610 family)